MYTVDSFDDSARNTPSLLWTQGRTNHAGDPCVTHTDPYPPDSSDMRRTGLLERGDRCPHNRLLPYQQTLERNRLLGLLTPVTLVPKDWCLLQIFEKSEYR